jgi:hypothetical protein
MPFTRRVLLTWLPLAGLATATALTIYVVTQQVWRAAANDPQVEIARGTVLALDGGQSPSDVVPERAVPMERSLATFVTVLDDSGRVLASSGRLRGEVRAIPTGVLEQVRRAGEERVTWQPERGVRIATVVERYSSGTGGGFVVVGRSLEEAQDRIEKFWWLIALSWTATLVGLLALVAITEWVRGGLMTRHS